MAKKTFQILPATWATNIRNTFHSLIALLVATLLIVAVYVTQNNSAREPIQNSTTITFTKSAFSRESISMSNKCNLFYGKWVFDNQTYPLYKERECTYMSDQLACEKFGRNDHSYQNWRWQPHHCDLPRFVKLKIIFS